jgi:hypothetical protein
VLGCVRAGFGDVRRVCDRTLGPWGKEEALSCQVAQMSQGHHDFGTDLSVRALPPCMLTERSTSLFASQQGIQGPAGQMPQQIGALAPDNREQYVSLLSGCPHNVDSTAKFEGHAKLILLCYSIWL